MSEKYGKKSDFMVMIAAVAVPLTFSMFREKVLGVNIRLSDVLFAILILHGLIYRTQWMAQEVVKKKYVGVGVFLLYVLLQGFVFNIITPSVKEVLQYACVIFGVIFCVKYSIGSEVLFRRWYFYGLMISAISTLAYHASIGIYSSYKMAGDGRYAFGNLSAFLYIFWVTERQKRWLYWFLVSLIPLYLSLERRGYFAVILVMVVSAMLNATKGLKINFGVVAIFIALTFAATFSAYLISENEDSKVNSNYSIVDEDEALWVSNVHRKSLLANGVDIFLQKPLFGYGSDQVKVEMQNYYFDARLANGTHNFYLDSMIKYGVVGVMLLLFGLLNIFLGKNIGIGEVLTITYATFSVAFMSDGGGVLVLIFYALLATINNHNLLNVGK